MVLELIELPIVIIFELKLVLNDWKIVSIIFFREHKAEILILKTQSESRLLTC
jgi:hypothetical protein